MVQQSTASLACVADLRKLEEACASDDDAPSRSTDSGSSSERSSGASRTITRSFVWADEEDSDDDFGVASSVVSAVGWVDQQSTMEGSLSSMPPNPPGSNQALHPTGCGGGQQWAMVAVSPCFVPYGQPSGFAQPFPVSGAVWTPQCVHQSAVQTFEVRSHFVQANAQADKNATEQLTTDHDDRTTLIVKNLPAGCTHHELCRILDEVGLGGLYNFVYVPFDFKKSVLFGYGFVSCEKHEHAVKAMATLDGFAGWAVDGKKPCVVEWSAARQSLQAIIERYRNSPVMHSSVPDECKPLLFERGVRIAFPAPTQDVDPPKYASRLAAQTSEVRSESLQATVEADRVASDNLKAVTEQLTSDRDGRTTLIVKNLPSWCTHDELRRILDDVGLSGLYNFIYVPYHFEKSVCHGYGLVNFEENEHAVKARAMLNGFSGWVVNGKKCCEVEWGGAQQSLQANIERYRNSSVMHSSVPDAYKPVLFEKGVQVAFPAPTQEVKPPKSRRDQQM